MGSWNFLRTMRCCTRTSRLGGNTPGPFFRWYCWMPRTHCSPRNASSASFSRWAWWRHTGSATLISTAITAMLTNNAAIA